MSDLPVNDLSPPVVVAPVKPGWQTSEFYGSWAVKIFGSLLATGVLGDGTIASRVVGAAMTLLALAGYTWSRTTIKAAVAPLALAVMLLGSGTMACTQAKADVVIAGAATLDCTKLEAPKLAVGIAQLAVALVTYVARLGSPDWDALVSAALADASNIKVCAIAEYRAAKAAADAASHAVAPPRPNDLDVAIARLRVGRGVTSIVTSAGAI